MDLPVEPGSEVPSGGQRGRLVAAAQVGLVLLHAIWPLPSSSTARSGTHVHFLDRLLVEDFLHVDAYLKDGGTNHVAALETRAG